MCKTKFPRNYKQTQNPRNEPKQWPASSIHCCWTHPCFFFLLILAKWGTILQILSNPQNNAMNINTKQRNIYIKVYISWDIKKCGIDLMYINPVPKGLIDLRFPCETIPQDRGGIFS